MTGGLLNKVVFVALILLFLGLIKVVGDFLSARVSTKFYYILLNI